MKAKLLIILMVVFWSMPLFAQSVDTAWVRRYNGPGDDEDWAWAIAVDDSGNVYVTGGSRGGATGEDYATIKYYPDGDTAWVRRYNGAGSGDDKANAIVVDGSGNVYVTGWSEGNYATIKYYPNGDTAWVRRYNGPGNDDDLAYVIAVDDSGNVYVTGESYGSGTDKDYATIKYYPNGDTAWVRTYNGPVNYRDCASAIGVDESGNIYVAGYSCQDSVNGCNYDYATIKYYPNGDTAWVRRYNGTGDHDDYLSAIAIDAFNNVYVTGNSRGSGSGYDFATVKYNADGDTAWVRRYNGPGDPFYEDDLATAIAVDDSNNVYVTGWSEGSGTGFDYATIKYYPNGDSAWVIRYNGPGNSTDIALAIATDGSGNVYVAGKSYGTGTDYDYATIKYYQHNDPPDPFSLLFPRKKSFTPRVVRFDWEDAVDPNPFNQVRYDLWVSTSYQFPLDSTTIDSDLTASEHVRTLDYGTYYWKVKAKDNFGAERWSKEIFFFRVTGYPHLAIGDLNLDGEIDVGDVVFLINHLFLSGSAPDPLELGDANCDDEVNIGDVIFLINFLFRNGPAPSC